MSHNYYQDLWTKQNQHGTIFFRNVNFDTPSYKLQELRFRKLLQSLKRLNKEYNPHREIKSVLEVGAGTGRMTKIVLEELPDYEWYTIVEISKENILKMFKTLGDGKELPPNIYPISGNIIEYVDLPTKETQYDLILVSEVFMHIKPEDIGSLIEKLTKLLAPNGLIINIDLSFHSSDNNISSWCFVHDYDKLYTENGLTPVYIGDLSEIQQKMLCYGK